MKALPGSLSVPWGLNVGLVRRLPYATAREAQDTGPAGDARRRGRVARSLRGAHRVAQKRLDASSRIGSCPSGDQASPGGAHNIRATVRFPVIARIEASVWSTVSALFPRYSRGGACSSPTSTTVSRQTSRTTI